MATQYPTASSQLIRGLPSPSYGAFRPNKGLPFHRPGQGSSRYAAPGPPPPTSTHFPELLSDLFPGSPKPPTTRWERPPIQPSTQGLSRPINTRIPSEPTRGLSERKTSRYCQGVTFWLVIIMVIQAVLIVCRSNTVAKFANLEFTARHASRERSALLAGREKSEQERAKMERERKLWEKVPEDHIPPGAYWKSIGPAYNCQAYGKREYQGMLQDIPRGWTAMDACMNTPANIEGATIRRPDRCAFVNGSPHIHGYWTVNWNQKDCKPWLKDIRDIGCTNYRSGLTRIEAKVEGIINRKEQDWRVMCESTPFIWQGVNYTSPLHCEERIFGTKIAMWNVPSESCRY